MKCEKYLKKIEELRIEMDEDQHKNGVAVRTLHETIEIAFEKKRQALAELNVGLLKQIIANQKALAKAIIELSEKGAKTWDCDGEEMLSEGIDISNKHEIQEIVDEESGEQK